MLPVSRRKLCHTWMHKHRRHGCREPRKRTRQRETETIACKMGHALAVCAVAGPSRLGQATRSAHPGLTNARLFFRRRTALPGSLLWPRSMFCRGGCFDRPALVPDTRRPLARACARTRAQARSSAHRVRHHAPYGQGVGHQAHHGRNHWRMVTGGPRRTPRGAIKSW